MTNATVSDKNVSLCAGTRRPCRRQSFDIGEPMMSGRLSLNQSYSDRKCGVPIALGERVRSRRREYDPFDREK
jgi:hypothetical protein